MQPRRFGANIADLISPVVQCFTEPAGPKLVLNISWREQGRLGERARSTANKGDRTKSMVLFYLISREQGKIEGRGFTLRVQKNSQDSVRVLDEPSLPIAYRKVEVRIGGVLW